MKINHIKINGFKALTEFSIDPEGRSVEVSGDNGQGKSSVIDAVWLALTGKECPGVPVNRHAIKADIEVGLDSGHTVSLEFGPKGKKLVVCAEDGRPVKAPQGFLDGLIGKISFDPFAFVGMTPKDQRTFLMQLLGLDFSDIETKKGAILESKRAADLDFKVIERQCDDLADAYETDAISVEEALEQQKIHEAANRELDARKHTLETLAEESNRIIDSRSDLEKQIDDLREKLAKLPSAEEMSAKIVRAETAIQEQEVALEEHPDVSEVIAQASQVNEAAKRWELRKTLRARYDAAKLECEKFARMATECEEEKKNRLMDAKLPVDGLGFTDDGVTFQGLPFDQGNQCQSDILRVGVAIAVAQNPNLRIVRIKDGSLFGEAKRAALLKTLSEFGFQAFIERVTEGPLKAITLEESAD